MPRGLGQLAGQRLGRNDRVGLLGKELAVRGRTQAGERGAILYTVIESCRRRRLDPYGYLREVLSWLPSMTNQQITENATEAWNRKHPVVL